MRKLIILMILLFIVLSHIDTKAATASKIDLRTKEDEINVIFLKLKNSTSVLVHSLSSSKLFLIDYKNDDGIDKMLDIFDIKPDFYFLDRVNGRVDDIYIKKKDHISININDHNLCIVKDLKKVDACDFIYLVSLNDIFSVNENTLALFYDEDIKDEYLSEVSESWIDSHIVSSDSFTILKLNKEEYNILIVPLANR